MFDIEAANECLAQVFASDVSPADGMPALIDFCTKLEKWRGWSAIRKLDYGADCRRLQKWLDTVLTKEPPSKSIKAYWFGMFNPVVDGETTCGIYVAGSNTFDADDDSFEWACDPAYFPNRRYAQSQVLDEIYRRVKSAKGDVPSYGEYVLCLGYAGLTVKSLAQKAVTEVWLGSKKQRAVAVGFDSGDGFLLGEIRKTGWKSA